MTKRPRMERRETEDTVILLRGHKRQNEVLVITKASIIIQGSNTLGVIHGRV